MSTPGTVNAFTQFLQLLENGRLHGELSSEITNIVAALEDHRSQAGKAKGKLVLTFDFAAEDGLIQVDGNFKTTLPKGVRSRSVFWATPENNLTVRNPRQGDLPFRDVTGGDGAPRSV